MVDNFEKRDRESRFEMIRKSVVGYFPEAESRADVKILDLAAGTGLVGEILHESGFRCFDAVDASKGMLAELAKKRIYQNIWEELLGRPSYQSIPNVPDNSYDVVILCGGLCNNHIDIGVLHQAHIALKPGGLFINIMGESYTRTVPELAGLEDLFGEMERQGKWKLLKREILDFCMSHICRKSIEKNSSMVYKDKQKKREEISALKIHQVTPNTLKFIF